MLKTKVIKKLSWKPSDKNNASYLKPVSQLWHCGHSGLDHSLFQWGCALHCRMFSNILVLHPLGCPSLSIIVIKQLVTMWVNKKDYISSLFLIYLLKLIKHKIVTLHGAACNVCRYNTFDNSSTKDSMRWMKLFVG